MLKNIAVDKFIFDVSYRSVLFVALLAPVVAMFSGASMIVFFVVAGLFPLVISIKDKNLKNICHSKINKTIIIYLFYAMMSIFWAIRPDQAFGLWYKLVLIFTGSYALYDFLSNLGTSQKKQLGISVVMGVVLAIIVANIEIISDGVITRFFLDLINKQHVYELVDLNRGAAFLSIIFWPAFAFLIINRKRALAVILAIVSVMALMRLESQSSVVAIIMGLLAYGFVSLSGRRGISVIMLLAVLAVPAVAVTAKVMEPAHMFKIIPQIPNSASEIRLYIWDFAAGKAAEKPVFGWGFNASRSIPVSEKDYVLNGRHPLPLHPHNNVLQVWLETGIVGLVLFTLFLLAIMQRTKDFESLESCRTSFKEANLAHKICRITANNSQRALAMGLVTTYFTIGQTGFGIWQSWWVACGILSSAFLYSLLENGRAAK